MHDIDVRMPDGSIVTVSDRDPAVARAMAESRVRWMGATIIGPAAGTAPRHEPTPEQRARLAERQATSLAFGGVMRGLIGLGSAFDRLRGR